MRKVSVIIVSWNIASSLGDCLTSIFATKYSNLEVIVIDNASTDSTAQVLKLFPKVTLVSNPTNLGFPKAVNQGLLKSTGEYLLILNPDTQVPKDFFDCTFGFFTSHPDAWLMGPKFTDPSGTPQGSVFQDTFTKITPSTSKPLVVNAVSGACLFFPRTTMDQVGIMTEEVFMYFEDLDYCRRIRKLGGKIYFNPLITITHQHGQSARQTPQTYKYLTESLLYPIRKLFHKPSTLPSTQRYLTEASIWYHGWPKHMLLTVYFWLRSKLGLQKGQSL